MYKEDIHYGLFEKGTKLNEFVPTHLESISHELTFHDLLIDSKVKQKFTNLNPKPVELEYKYRSTCAPHFMEVSLYDPETGKKDILKASVHTKEIAIEKYDDSLASGNRGILMEKDENVANLYILSLGNIKPKMEIVIETHIVYTAILETDEEDCDKIKFYHSIPALSPETTASEEEEQKTQSIQINALNALNVVCTSHDEILEKINENIWKTKKSISVTREFEIEIFYEKYPFSSFTYSPLLKKYKNYNFGGILSLIPNFAAQPVKGYELILIVDCSGSMSGNRMTCAVEALKLFIQSLDVDRRIKYNIIRFGSSFNKCFSNSVELRDDENLKKAKEYIRTTSANLGGTDMQKPIKSVFGNETDVNSDYTKQLFLFTDGEDSYPRQIEECLKIEHKKTKVRCFSFGIGRGINRTFLENCAAFTKGSACFIEDIREEMKSQVLKQLSNAFRTSIDEIRILQGLKISSDIVEASKINEIPQIFNGRSHHKYYFLKDIPEKIEVEYEFLGNKVAEKVGVLGVDDASVGVRVASEFVSNSKDPKDIEILGLNFNLPTSKTSFFLESKATSKVFSEMRIEEVAHVKKKNVTNDWNDCYGISATKAFSGFHGSGWESSAPSNSVSSKARNFFSQLDSGTVKKKYRKKVVIPIEPQKISGSDWVSPGTFKPKKEFSGNNGDDWSAKGSGKVTKEFSGTVGDDWSAMGTEKATKEFSGTVGDDWSAKGTEKATKEFSGTIGDDWTAKGTEKATKEFSGIVGDDWTAEGTEFSGSVGEEWEEEEIEEEVFEEQEENNISGWNSDEVKKSIKFDNLSKILLMNNIKGVWTCTKEVLELIGFKGSKELFLKESKPDESFTKDETGISLWLTAVIIAILQRFYRNKKSEWLLISKKSLKSIKAKFGAAMVSEAKKFVGGL